MSVKPEWAEKDYYADLGVSSSASQAEIKKAYRKIARDNHPDTHPDDQAKLDRFKVAGEAYEVLGDESSRKEYDEFKAMVARGGFGAGGAGFPGGFPGGFSGGFPGAGAGGPGAGANFSFSDLSDLFGNARGASQGGSFRDFFGGGFNGGGGPGTTTHPGRASRPSRGADIETHVTLEFREAALGTMLPLQLSGDAPCSSCHGSGSVSGKPATCSACNGTGFTSQNRGSFGFSSPCSECGGKGSTISDPCPDCNGKGTVHRTRSIRVRIPAGVTDGQKVRLAGQGEAGPNGTPAGDLFVQVTVKPDKLFSREGDDLLITVPVSFAELALGDTITVPTLGQPVRVKIQPGTPDGQTLRVRGRGIERRGAKAGDLLVTVKISVPSHLDPAATSALRAYAQAEKESGFQPRATFGQS